MTDLRSILKTAFVLALIGGVFVVGEKILRSIPRP